MTSTNPLADAGEQAARLKAEQQRLAASGVLAANARAERSKAGAR